ncbi:MAG: hypothetical protein QG568_182 [Patescibacteria group bacterium]|nr:hypothetical protein [Patescibacteria group bacterium]
MEDAQKINVYIDGNNLYRAAKELGFDLDYKKFRGWLRQKYKPQSVYLFIGLIPERSTFYQHLQECGFILIFKQTVSIKGTVKGNCDAELVLKSVSDFYTKTFDSCILITGDGDFGCLVEFLRDSNALSKVLSPSEKRCSILIKNKNIEITFLDSHYHKFSDMTVVTSIPEKVQETVQNVLKNGNNIQEKTPGADVSTQGFSS